MVYLGLDLSSETGWAIKSADNRPPVCGTYRFKQTGPDLAACFLPFMDFLDELTREHDIEAWCYETVFAGDMADPLKLCKHFGRPVVVEIRARQIGVKCKEVMSSSWRKNFIGVGQGPRGLSRTKRQTWLKRRALQECRIRNWPVENHNEAEACGILNFWLCHDFPDYAANDNPLFWGAQ